MKNAAFAVLFTGVMLAQTPAVTHAQFATRAVSGDPGRFLRELVKAEAGPMWFGYSVPSQQSDNESCCWDQNNAGCYLEGEHGGRIVGTRSTEPLKLEGSSNLFVLYRVENHAIQKVHPVSDRCPLDAGGLRFVWLTGVTPAASIGLLSDQVGSASGKHDADPALVAISMHAGDGADAALERFTAPSEPEWLREKALFWLASARGERGFTAIRNAAEHDPSEEIRKKIMFDFSISSQPAAVDQLIHYAKQDPSARVREQALFWLAQKAGQRAAEAIKDAIVNDPETEVKKKAVFALQQLPKDQGVPLMIEVAKTNRNAEVRKQAMFWLGQSGDPRAVAFFQQVLTGKM